MPKGGEGNLGIGVYSNELWSFNEERRLHLSWIRNSVDLFIIYTHPGGNYTEKFLQLLLVLGFILKNRNKIIYIKWCVQWWILVLNNALLNGKFGCLNHSVWWCNFSNSRQVLILLWLSLLWIFSAEEFPVTVGETESAVACQITNRTLILQLYLQCFTLKDDKLCEILYIWPYK